MENIKILCSHYGLPFKKIRINENLTNVISKEKSLGRIGIIIQASQVKNLINLSSLDKFERAINNKKIKFIILGDEIESNTKKLISKFVGNYSIRFKRQNSQKYTYYVCNDQPDITREFTGVIKSVVSNNLNEFDIEVKEDSKETSFLITKKNNKKDKFIPLFIQIREDKKEIYIASAKILSQIKNPLINYFNWEYFQSIAPVMMFLRYIGGQYCWHREIDYANLTIDDPNLKEPYGNLSYIKLLKSMKKNDYHTTIAFIPYNYMRIKNEVVDLFLKNDKLFSLAIHGNNHDHREFGSYKKRSLREQEQDINQAVVRMEKLKDISNLKYNKVMIFPHGIAPEKTLELLKQYNFLCTVNAGNIPLDKKGEIKRNSNLEPAILDYEGFPSIDRIPANSEKYIFNLFLDKPIIFYDHVYGKKNIFRDNLKTFENKVRNINNTPYTKIQWGSLEDIGKHLYLKKFNLDGSLSIKIYSNETYIQNKTETTKKYYIQRYEKYGKDILEVLINGKPKNYKIEKDILKLDLILRPKEKINFKIRYKNKNINKSIVEKTNLKISILRHGSEFRDNYLSTNDIGLYIIHLWEKLGFTKILFVLTTIIVLFFTITVYYIYKKTIGKMSKRL
jgi:hypothetical protein